MKTYGQGVNHGFVSHVHLSTSDDLGDIAGVVRLKDRDLDTLIREEA